MPSIYAPRIVLLSSRFRLPGRTLLYGRARLFPDRIELLGLATTGWHRERIPLAGVQGVEWSVDPVGLVVLRHRDGSAQTLALDQAPSWKQAIEARLPWTAAHAELRAYAAPELSLPDLVAYATSMS